ncbi:MAG TPA: hypothetical protein VMN36_07075 [Verrucomicrobiales bacterium]|nr:hypothetical protein [Verrucomicrobiales bacterium]
MRNPVAQREAWKAVAEALAKRNPAAAVRWVSSIEDRYHRTEALSKIVSVSLQRDPAKAAEAFALMPDTPRKGMHVEAVMGHLTRQDPQAAASWVREHLHGSIRDQAMAGVVSVFNLVDKDSLMQRTLRKTAQNPVKVIGF